MVGKGKTAPGFPRAVCFILHHRVVVGQRKGVARPTWLVVLKRLGRGCKPRPAREYRVKDVIDAYQHTMQPTT